MLTRPTVRIDLQRVPELMLMEWQLLTLLARQYTVWNGIEGRGRAGQIMGHES